MAKKAAKKAPSRKKITISSGVTTQIAAHRLQRLQRHAAKGTHPVSRGEEAEIQAIKEKEVRRSAAQYRRSMKAWRKKQRRKLKT